MIYFNYHLFQRYQIISILFGDYLNVANRAHCGLDKQDRRG